ncbi:MAG: hypothetical protein QW705_01745 [Zestosphaera sp.]
MLLPASCLDDSFLDRDVVLLRQAIRRFVVEAEITRSIDGYLILLGGLVLEIEERGAQWAPDYDPREVLRKVLSCAEVAKALSPLAGYAEDVEDLVNSGPRHKSLRPYLGIITEFLNGMPPSRKKLEVVRPPISELERTPSTGPESGTHAPPHMPAEAAGYSIPVEDGGGAVRRVLGYASLIALLAGISYFSYALLVKYGLMKPLQWIPLP